MQVALNDPAEYEGGDLVFYQSNRHNGGQAVLKVLRRPPLTAVQHPSKVLHAVSRMTAGTRKSMFILDSANGMGQEDVHDVTTAQVMFFRTLDEANIPDTPDTTTTDASITSVNVVDDKGWADEAREEFRQAREREREERLKLMLARKAAKKSKENSGDSGGGGGAAPAGDSAEGGAAAAAIDECAACGTGT